VVHWLSLQQVRDTGGAIRGVGRIIASGSWFGRPTFDFIQAPLFGSEDLSFFLLEGLSVVIVSCGHTLNYFAVGKTLFNPLVAGLSDIHLRMPLLRLPAAQPSEAFGLDLTTAGRLCVFDIWHHYLRLLEML